MAKVEVRHYDNNGELMESRTVEGDKAGQVILDAVQHQATEFGFETGERIEFLIIER